MFHCVIENGMVYLCAASPDFGKKQPYAYLAEVTFLIWHLCFSGIVRLFNYRFKIKVLKP